MPAVLAFALSVGREPSIIFLGLFLVPTICIGVAAIFRRVTPLPFLVVAASDVLVAVALSVYQSKTASWDFPSIGGWGFGGGFAAGAALIRLAAPAAVADRREAGLSSLVWWQGALLAYWSGRPAGAVLIAGGVALWAAAAVFPRGRLEGLTFAGGTLAIAAGLGAALPGILVIGLAGVALALGERAVSSWTIAVLPLSILTAGVLLPTGPYMALPAVVLPAAWALMSRSLGSIKVIEGQLGLLLGLAIAGAAVWLAALGWSFAPIGGGAASLPLTGDVENAGWLLYGVALAAWATYGLTGSGWLADVDRERVGDYSQFNVLVPGLIPPVAWIVVGVSIILIIRLYLAGLRTGFL
ncbi:MAG: hypothetical protein M3164_04395 [Actinomycetota bacterium]|nr:hypothetical protein [Actinomycetota bacterium]